MTRAHAAIQLLRLGPLARAEFIEITGWPRQSADRVLSLLCQANQIHRCKFGVYEIRGVA